MTKSTKSTRASRRTRITMTAMMNALGAIAQRTVKNNAKAVQQQIGKHADRYSIVPILVSNGLHTPHETRWTRGQLILRANVEYAHDGGYSVLTPMVASRSILLSICLRQRNPIIPVSQLRIARTDGTVECVMSGKPIDLTEDEEQNLGTVGLQKLVAIWQKKTHFMKDECVAVSQEEALALARGMFRLLLK